MLDSALDAALNNPIEMMTRLPESVTDPFVSLRKRTQAAVALYKFGESAGGLLDWAAVQTGLRDPMTRFNRHELERLFERFRINLDAHLRKLVKDVRRQDPAALAEATSAAGPLAKQALRRADADR